MIHSHVELRHMEAHTDVANLKVLSHEEVEGGGGVAPDASHAAAAVSEEAETEVSTQLGILLEQHLGELNRNTEEFD